MIDKEFFNQFCQENIDQDITVFCNDRQCFSGALKKFGATFLTLSTYTTSKLFVSTDGIIAFYSSKDKPEDKYLPAMAEYPTIGK